MGRKSETCLGKLTGTPLTEYDSVEEAQEEADYINNSFNKNMISYKCSKCKKWHLAPKNRQTRSTKCSNCISADGRPKSLYFSKSDAQLRAEIIRNERGLYLTVYKCPQSQGWHLTKTHYS